MMEECDQKCSECVSWESQQGRVRIFTRYYLMQKGYSVKECRTDFFAENIRGPHKSVKLSCRLIIFVSFRTVKHSPPRTMEHALRDHAGGDENDRHDHFRQREADLAQR